MAQGAPRRNAHRRNAEGMTARDLADSLGSTVRALRHYEEASLLTPRRDGRHTRLYGPEDRARAELIVVLRRADVPLKTIEAALNGSSDIEAQGVADLLEARLAAARAQVAEIERLLPAVRSGQAWRHLRPDADREVSAFEARANRHRLAAEPAA